MKIIVLEQHEQKGKQKKGYLRKKWDEEEREEKKWI